MFQVNKSERESSAKWARRTDSLIQGYDVSVPGVGAGQSEGQVVRLTAGVDEEAHAQLWGEERREPGQGRKEMA